MTLTDLVLSWLRLRVKPKPAKRTYPRTSCPVCGADVATSATSPKRHKCEPKAEVGDAR